MNNNEPRYSRETQIKIDKIITWVKLNTDMMLEEHPIENLLKPTVNDLIDPNLLKESKKL